MCVVQYLTRPENSVCVHLLEQFHTLFVFLDMVSPMYRVFGYLASPEQSKYCCCCCCCCCTCPVLCTLCVFLYLCSPMHRVLKLLVQSYALSVCFCTCPALCTVCILVPCPVLCTWCVDTLTQSPASCVCVLVPA